MPVDMKSLIAESLMKLIQRNGLDKVTVKALIEECHISRQTFYYHFQDMMDVLEYIIRQVTRQLEEESLRAETPREALKVFVAFSVERFPMLRRLLDSQRRTQVEQLMLEAVMGYLSTLAQEGPQDLPISMGDREVLLRYNAWGLVGVLLEYAGKPDLDQDRLASQLERIVSGEIAGWREN